MMQETEKEIQNALLTLAEKTPLEKIRTVDICRMAEVSKQTFYNHYRDKYDVIAKIFITDMYNITGENEETFSHESLTASNQKIFEKRDFYKKAFSLKEQNSLMHMIMK